MTARRSATLLMVSVFLLIALGFVMLMSTVGFTSGSDGGPEEIWGKLHRQLMWCGLGSAALAFFAFCDYHKLERYALGVFLLSIVVLICCFIPGIGKGVNGAHRWIGIPGSGTILGQPSEAARIGTIVFLAAWMSRWRLESQTLRKGFLYPLLLVGIPIGLIAFEVDLGTAVLVFSVCACILFAGGTKWYYIAGMLLLGAVGLGIGIKLIPNRLARITAFVHLEDPDKSKLTQEIREMMDQQEEGLSALGSGGPLGLGLGEGRHKQGYLPLPFTDFIFPNIGEELGLPGTLGTVLLFGIFCLSGLLIASHAPDRFGKLLGSGLVLLIVFQALINIAVTTGCMPNKGMPLPFISYGGSNLACCMAGIGILLNIQRQARPVIAMEDAVLSRPKLTPSV